MNKKVVKESLKIKGIIPFKEKPCTNYFENNKEGNVKDEIRASDLFSFFTADIIKEQVVFTR